MAYVAPLRQVVIDLGRRGKPWTVEAMAHLGGAEVDSAKGYATHLCRSGVLIALAGGRYVAGRFFYLWAEVRPKTKPGGNRKLKAPA